ncbi:hypothetical protein J5N97_008557 [Dioscorea zingiberensis]|uniref:Uncharacterized protein n=1 Tax=Dioscorea zingiberensis TaxID=325984 RepID=A0A9D5CWJ0_9LILI|nr:hypothetical protein J5N97_008557 [Dioscorea zingiberensis]
MTWWRIINGGKRVRFQMQLITAVLLHYKLRKPFDIKHLVVLIKHRQDIHCVSSRVQANPAPALTQFQSYPESIARSQQIEGNI